MPDTPGPGRFRAVAIGGSAALVVAAAIYARAKGIPAGTAFPLALAFLIELPFFLLPAFSAERLRNPAILAGSCVLPYLAYSLPTGEFTVAGLLLLTAIAAAIAFWFRILPRSRWADLLFLALVAAVYLSKVFDRIYLSPIPKAAPYLGHIMLIRASATAVLAIRGDIAARFRFLPSAAEWLAGLRWSLPLLAASGGTLWAVGLWRPRPHPNLALGLAQFIGILWVVALSEEFFFRGLLQQWLEDILGNPVAALLVTSLMFGSVHLGFHGVFPNWRFAIVAVVFGLFCGLAWRERRSVQASMVAHAVGATLYRVFFQ